MIEQGHLTAYFILTFAARFAKRRRPSAAKKATRLHPIFRRPAHPSNGAVTSRLFTLFHQLAIEALQDIKRLLSFTPVRDQPFAVIEVLNVRQRSAGRAKIGQNPGRHAAQSGNLSQHGDLMFVQILLVFFRPLRAFVTVPLKLDIMPLLDQVSESAYSAPAP